MTDPRIRDRADRLTQAVNNNIEWATDDALSGLRTDDLRALALELAKRVNASRMDGTVHDAIVMAARTYGTTIHDVLSASRRHEAVRARQVGCYAARLLGYSFSEIGRQIDRDHSTVMNGISRVGETPAMRRQAERIATGMGWVRGADEETA